MNVPICLTLDPISSADAGTLPGLFGQRCIRTPGGEAYRQYDLADGHWRHCSWRDMHALLVLKHEGWQDLARSLGQDPDDPDSLDAPVVTQAVRDRIDELPREFPAYPRVRVTRLMLEAWTIENGLVTPTMKLRCPAMERRFAEQIQALYRRVAR